MTNAHPLFPHIRSLSHPPPYDNPQGLDTPTPLLKIGNKIFVGAAQWLIGSEMIFRDDRGECGVKEGFVRVTAGRSAYHF